MSSLELTQLLGVFVSLLALVALPVYLHKQQQKQRAADKAAEAEEKKEAKRQEEVDRQAVIDAATRAAKEANEGVTMKTINETIAKERDRLTVLLEREGIGHQKEILTLQARFTEETERLKRRTDEDMSKANAQIRQLIDEVRLLNHRLSGGTAVMERPELPFGQAP